MKKIFLFLILAALFLTACSKPQKNTKEAEKETKTEKADNAIQLLETEKLDGAMEYCFEVADFVKLFADEFFIQSKESGNLFFRIEQGKKIESTAEETVLKDTFLFNNPYHGREEEITLEIHGLVLNNGNFYMTENGNSGKFVKYEDGTQEWQEISVEPAWRSNLVWLNVAMREPDIADTTYYLLYDLNEKKAKDIVRDAFPEGFPSSHMIISPDSQGLILHSGQLKEQPYYYYYYMNAISGEVIFLKDLLEKPQDTIGFKDERTLILTLEREAGRTEKFRYDVLDKKLYGELEKITPERIAIENSAAYVQLENDVYTLHTSERSIPLKELDSKKNYRFQASPSGNKIAITEEGNINQLCVFDLEKESSITYPQKFSSGQQKELGWAGENGFWIEMWGGNCYFYEF